MGKAPVILIWNLCRQFFFFRLLITTKSLTLRDPLRFFAFSLLWGIPLLSFNIHRLSWGQLPVDQLYQIAVRSVLIIRLLRIQSEPELILFHDLTIILWFFISHFILCDCSVIFRIRLYRLRQMLLNLTLIAFIQLYLFVCIRLCERSANALNLFIMFFLSELITLIINRWKFQLNLVVLL